MATYETIATNQVDNLQLDEMPFVQYAVTIKSGENLTRGELVGKITASGKYIKWTSGASDGSQTVAGVLVDDCDATAGDTAAKIYVTGVFNKDAIPTSGAAAGLYFNSTCNIVVKDID